MSDIPGLVLSAFSLAALSAGVRIEYGQRSESGPVAIVPTLQYALAAGIFAAMGVGLLCVAHASPLAWWLCPLALLLVVGLGAWLIAAVGDYAERRHRR